MFILCNTVNAIVQIFDFIKQCAHVNNNDKVNLTDISKL